MGFVQGVAEAKEGERRRRRRKIPWKAKAKDGFRGGTCLKAADVS